MKSKKIKIFILIIVAILIIVFIPIVRKKILLYQVRDKFLATMYDIKRNGNYHVVYFYKSIENNNIVTSDIRWEVYAKDGESLRISNFENMDGTTSKMVRLMQDSYEYNILERSDGLVSGIYRPNRINTDTTIVTIVANILYNGQFKKVEEGEYNGKSCYIATVEYDVETKDTIYIDKETYYPMRMESNNFADGFYEEYEWLTLEIGIVKKLPEYDLDTIKENSESALELENREKQLKNNEQ